MGPFIMFFFNFSRFPNSRVLIEGKMLELAPLGDADSMVDVLQQGEYPADVYNMAYFTFVESKQTAQGMKIVIAAAEKFPEDPVSDSLWSSLLLWGLVTAKDDAYVGQLGFDER